MFCGFLCLRFYVCSMILLFIVLDSRCLFVCLNEIIKFGRKILRMFESDKKLWNQIVEHACVRKVLWLCLCVYVCVYVCVWMYVDVILLNKFSVFCTWMQMKSCFSDVIFFVVAYMFDIFFLFVCLFQVVIFYGFNF